MCISIVNQLKIPMAKYDLDGIITWDRYINKLHVSVCSYKQDS